MAEAYSTEEDLLIWETVKEAEADGIALRPVFTRLSETLGRTAGGLQAHYQKLVRDNFGGDNDGIGASDDFNLASRVKTAIRERDAYKAKYEALRKDYDILLKDVEPMQRELRQIKKLFG